MVDWESLFNVMHYHVVERHLAPWSRTLTRRWRVWRGNTSRILELCRPAPRPPDEEEEKMPETETVAVAPAVVGRAILSRLDREAVTAVTTAIAEEIRTSVMAECVVEARRQLEDEFHERAERQLDRLARDRTALEDEADRRIEAEVAAQVAAEKAEWDDRLTIAREQRRAWRARAEASEALLTDLIRQVVGEVGQRPVYLFSGGKGLTRLDKTATNAVLARSGLVLRSKASPSERVVTVQLGDGRQGEHALFWLATVDVPGVAPEADDDES
jgi:hypothetical protein